MYKHIYTPKCWHSARGEDFEADPNCAIGPSSAIPTRKAFYHLARWFVSVAGPFYEILAVDALRRPI